MADEVNHEALVLTLTPAIPHAAGSEKQEEWEYREAGELAVQDARGSFRFGSWIQRLVNKLVSAVSGYDRGADTAAAGAATDRDNAESAQRHLSNRCSGGWRRR